MKSDRMAGNILTTAVALSLVASAACAADISSPILAGSKEVVWLIKPAMDGQGSQILFKKLNKGKWSQLPAKLQTAPTTAAATGQVLHVGFQGGGYVIFSSVDSGDLTQVAMDSTPLAFCPVGDSNGSILGIVIRDEMAVSKPTSTETAPAGSTLPVERPARRESRRWIAPPPSQGSTGLTQVMELAVYRHVGGQWTPMAALPGVRLDPSNSRVLAAMMGDSLYVLIVDRGVSRFVSCKEGLWQELPLAEELAKATPLAMEVVGDRLLLVVQEADASLKIATWGATMRRFSVRPVMLPDGEEPMPWKRQGSPWVTRFGDGLALAWRQKTNEKDAYYFSICEISGLAQPAGEISFAEMDGRGGKVIEYFTYGVLICVFIPMLLVRPRAPIKPFTLPVEAAPGNLLRRLVAALIDLAPLMLLCTATFGVPEMTPEDVQEILKNPQSIPLSVALASVASLSLYVVYCILMEKRFGRTLGKKLMGLRVVGDEARPLTWREAAMRNMLKIVELSMPFFFILLILPLFNRNRQRLGDMIARTAVIAAAKAGPRPTP